MNVTLSWKISSGIYAYVYIPNSDTHISKKIPSDSAQWEAIIEVVSDWKREDYISNFNLMAEEVKRRFGISMTFQKSYWGVSGDTINSKNIIILSSDGGGSGSGGSGGPGSGGGSGAGGTVGTNDIDVSVYDKFNEMIDSKLNEAREDLNKQNEAVQKFVEDKVTETIAEARETIAETKKELGDVREELTNQLEGATETLNKAASLFEFGEQNITAESIIGVFNSVDEFGGWLSGYSGSVMDIKADYDLATERMGTIGTAEDATLGLFSRVATSLSNISGTVGTVQETMDASTGTIEQLATWYDNNVSSVTEATRMIVASASLISDSVEFINGEGLTSKIVREIDGAKAQIKDEILVETEEIVSNVESTMNAMSGFIMNKITMVDNKTSALTQMEDKMDALAGTMERYMTITEETNGLTYDLRDEWSKQSGKVSTVASLTAELDENGEVMYFASGSSVGEERVFKNSDDEWVGEKSGRKFGEKEVYFHIADTMMSYIQQTTSSITLSVVGSEEVTAGLTAGLKLGLKEDSSFISLIADEVVIDADVIAKAISAKTANIGGIMIGDGIVKAMATGQVMVGHYASAMISTFIEYPVIKEGDNWKFNTTFDNAYVITDEDGFNTYWFSGGTSEEDFYSWQVVRGGANDTWVAVGNAPCTDETVYTDTNGNYVFSASTLVETTNEVMQSGSTWVDRYGRVYPENNVFEKSEPRHAFELDGRTGKIKAFDAEIYGAIHAKSGEIGGMSIHDNMLEVKEKNLSDEERALAVLNGSEKHKHPKKGKVVMASGIDEDATMYVYKPYKPVFATTSGTFLTNEIITYNNGYINDENIQTYTYDETEKEYYTDIDNYKFYYEICNSGDTKENIIISENDTTNTFINEYIRIRKEGSFPYLSGKQSDGITANPTNLGNSVYQFTIAGFSSYPKKTITTNTYNHIRPNDGRYFYEIGKSTYYYWVSVIFSNGQPTDFRIHRQDANRTTQVETYYQKYIPNYSLITVNNIDDTLEIELKCDYDSIFEWCGEEYIYIIDAYKAINDKNKYKFVYFNKTDKKFYYLKEVSKNNTATIINDGFTSGTTHFTLLKKTKDIKHKGYFWGTKEDGTCYHDGFNTCYKFEMVEIENIEFVSVEINTFSFPVENLSLMASTKIYSNGDIETNYINALDGYFGGEINSSGTFNGTLHCNGGTLENTIIKTDNLSGNFSFRENDSMTFSVSASPYFSVTSQSLLNEQSNAYISAKPFTIDAQNRNGKNEGKYYTNYDSSFVIASFYIRSGGTLWLPTIEVNLNRYAPFKRTNKQSSVEVRITCTGVDGIPDTGATHYYGGVQTFGSFNGKGWRKETKSYSFKNLTGSNPRFTASHDMFVEIELFYNIHLSTYYWLGFDRAYFSLSVKPQNNELIRIEYNDIPQQFTVAPDGIKFFHINPETKHETKIDANEFGIVFQHYKYSLTINDNGISYSDGNTTKYLIQAPS